MANKKNDETNTNDEAGATEGKTDQRFMKLNVPAGDPSGLEGEVKRVDYIRALWKTGDYTRGEIRKMVCDLGDDIAYQIVFQATKGQGAGKMADRGKKAEEAEEATEVATEESAAE